MDYIKYLLRINSAFCKDSKIRTTNTNYLNIIEDAYNDAIVSDDYETVFNKAIYVAALIKLYQPFYDGNNRTALAVYNDIITKKGYYFNYDQAANDMKNKKLIIPTIYEVDDKISNVSNWKFYSKENENNTKIDYVYKYTYVD